MCKKPRWYTVKASVQKPRWYTVKACIQKPRWYTVKASRITFKSNLALTNKLRSRSSTELTRHITPTQNGHPRSIFVDDGIDLEIVLHRHLTALALHLVTAVAVFLVNADHDAWHVVPTDNRRKITRRASSLANPALHIPLSSSACSIGYLNVKKLGLLCASSRTLLSFWSMVPDILGLSTIEGYTARRASSPANPFSHMPLPGSASEDVQSAWFVVKSMTVPTAHTEKTTGSTSASLKHFKFS